MKTMKLLPRGLAGHVILAVTVCLAAAHLTLTAAADWSYSGELGPSSWHKKYPDCGGKRQSPINLNTKNGLNITHVSKPAIKWMFYNKNPTSMTLINNGHTIQVKPTEKNGRAPHLEIGSKIFELDQTHFHWGNKNTEGSEHTVDSRRFPLEMHAVHRRVVDGKLASPPEFVVITIFFEVSKQRNPGLDRFLQHVHSVKSPETQVEIQPFPAATLIPRFDAFYFQYQGSLTTPPCSEVVTFYIREESSKVSGEQLELFRVALNDENEELAGNFRPTQPLNGRIIHYVVS